MYYAALYLGFCKHGRNDFGKAFEVINASNQNISYAPVLKVSEYAKPKIGTFRFIGTA